MKVSKKILGTVVLGVALAAGTAYAAHTDVNAATTYLGVDWAKYQGNNGVYGPNDEFAIAQIGGTYNGTINTQSTYASQVTAAGKRGLRAHTYIWYQVGSSTSVAKGALDYFLPRVKTPKGSIVALDYESGATGSKSANTNAIIYGMNRIKAAGYTPMLYSGQVYLNTHVDMKAVLAKYPNSLWVARYADYAVRNKPNFNYFPSMDGVAIWQYTSMQVAGGLDGNVDLTGITFNGYRKGGSTAPSSSSAPKVTMSQSTYNSKGAVNDGTQLYYLTNTGMINGPKAAWGTYTVSKKGTLNGSTYYLLNKNGKAYAWVKSGSIKLGQTAVKVTMTQSNYSATGNVSGGTQLYYFTNSGMTSGPKATSGSYKAIKKGVLNGTTYYLLSKDGKNGFAWVKSASFRTGSSNNGGMSQDPQHSVATVKGGARLYYYTNSGLINGPVSKAGDYTVLSRGVKSGATYYLLSQNGKSGYAWAPAKALSFNTNKNKMTQSNYTATAKLSASRDAYYYTGSGLTPAANVAAGSYSVVKKGTFLGSTYYLLSHNGRSGFAWVAASSVRF